MEKTSAGTGLGTYRRGDVLTDIALVTPGQLLVYESIRFGSVNLCKVTETFKDKYYAIFVNPENPAEKSKSSDEEFVVYPTDLKQGEYYIALEPSPEQVGEPSKKAKEPKGMPITPEAPTVSEEAGTPMATPEGAPAVEEAPITGSKKTAGGDHTSTDVEQLEKELDYCGIIGANSDGITNGFDKVNVAVIGAQRSNNWAQVYVSLSQMGADYALQDAWEGFQNNELSGTDKDRASMEKDAAELGMTLEDYVMEGVDGTVYILPFDAFRKLIETTEAGKKLNEGLKGSLTTDFAQVDADAKEEAGYSAQKKSETEASKKTSIVSPVRKQKDYGEEPFSAQERIDKIQTKLNRIDKKADVPSWVPVVELDNQTDYFKYSNALADAGIACSYEEKGGKRYVRIAADVLADATDKQKITEIIVTTGIGKNLLSEPEKKQESLKTANDPYVVKEPNLSLEEKLPFANLLTPRDVVEASEENDNGDEDPDAELESEYEFVYPKDTQESNELGEEYFDDPEAITINEDELTAYYAGKRIAKITSEQYGSQGLDALAEPIYKWMEREQYWPSVILQGERGNQTVLSINKIGALDNFEMRPLQEEEFEDSLGSRDTFALGLFANTEAQAGSDTDGDGDDGSAYDLLDGRNFSGVNEENAEGVVAEYLDGKAMSLASFEDFSGFVEDIYGIPKELTAEYEDAWVDEDSRKLVACILDNAVRNAIG